MENLEQQLYENEQQYHKLLSDLQDLKRFDLVDNLITIYRKLERIQYERGANMVKQINKKYNN